MKKRYWIPVLLITVAVAFYWLGRERHVAQFNQQVNDEKQAFIQRGEAFGAQGNQFGCLEKTLEATKECRGFSCSINDTVFFKSCLNTAAPSAGFCKDVPPFSEELSEDDKAWIKDSCLLSNVYSDSCKLVMKQRMLFCSQLEG